MFSGHFLKCLVSGQRLWQFGVALRTNPELVFVVVAFRAEQIPLVALVNPLGRKANVRAGHAGQLLLQIWTVTSVSGER